MPSSESPPVNGAISLDIEISDLTYQALQHNLKRHLGRDLNDHINWIVKQYLLLNCPSAEE